MPGLVGCTAAPDLSMLFRTFISHSFSGCFLRCPEKAANRGEALGGTGLFAGVPGVYPEVYTERFSFRRRKPPYFRVFIPQK